jgi:N utilization substance protein B
MPNEPKQNPDTNSNKSMNPVARRNARRYAMQAMYIWEINHAPMVDIEKEFVQFHINKEYDHPYFKELIHGIAEHEDEILQNIVPHLARPLDEVDPIEKAILKVGVYELLKRPDVPYRVVINEALELTKKYGAIEGYKFVNGILDKVAKLQRVIEINSQEQRPPSNGE